MQCSIQMNSVIPVYLLPGLLLLKVNGGNTGTGKKNVEAVAKEVLAGKWGNGEDRKKRLQAAGYDYGAVQRKVNELMR